jgi:hypothetical protein
VPNTNKNTIIFILIGVIIILGAVSIFNNYNNSKNSLPPQMLLSEEEWDFGLVKPDEKPSHIFTIKNEGNEDLILERVKSSCGCVKTTISTKNIKLGKSAELKVTFNTTGYEGKVKKDIHIKSNDPYEPERRITLSIEIEHQPKPIISLSKTEWDIGLLSQGDNPTLTFTIENQGDENLIIDKIDSFEHIKHNIDTPLTVLPEEKYKAVLTYNSNDHELGEFRESIGLYCNDPKKKALSFHVKGYIKEKSEPMVSIYPVGTNLSLAADSEEGAIGRFTMENLGDKSIKIISINTSIDYLVPLRSEFELGSKEKEDFQIVLLKDKAKDEIKGGDESEEYLYLTIALPIKISK